MSDEDDAAPRRPRFEAGFSALVFALLASWFVWTPLARLGRETLSPVDVLQASPVFALDPSWRPGNVSQAEVATRHHAGYAIDRASFARGKLPVWDRFSGFGAPHLARPASAVLSPFTWLHCALPLDRAALLEAFAKLFLAGFLAYGFLAALRLAPVACSFGACAFLFSGTMIEHLARPRSAVALALPAGLWVLESLARRLERDPPHGAVALHRLASPAHAALFAVIVAFGLAAGDPQAFAWVACVLGLFAALRGHSVWKRAAGRAGAGVGLLSVGAQLGLVAFLAACACGLQLVPFAEYLGESAVARERLAGGVEALARAAWPSVVFPSLLGDPAASASGTIAAFVGPLTLFCALLAPFAVRGRRTLAFFAVTALAWVVFAYDVFGFGSLVRVVPAFRLVSVESGLPFLHFALAACAAFLVHQLFARGPRRIFVACVATLCAALTLLFVARAGAARFVLDTAHALAPGAESSALASEAARHVVVSGAWFAAGVVLLASVWVLRDKRLRLAALLGCIVVLVASTAAPLRFFHGTSPNAFVFPRTAALEDLSARAGAHRLAFIGPAPIAPRVAASAGIESLANADGIGIGRVEVLRNAFFAGDTDGTNVRWAARRGLHVFGIDRVLHADPWLEVDTWTGFAAEDRAAEYSTGPLVPDAAVELDFRCPHERTNAIRVCFETGGRPLLQNIGLEVVDRVTGEQLAQHVIQPDFVHPNREPRVFGVLPLPRLGDWKSRKLRLVVRSNDGVTTTAWSLVARRDWTSVMNLGLWRRDGVRALPVDLRHPEFTGFRCRQYGRELRGSIVVDAAWDTDQFSEDGSVATYRVSAFANALRPFRTVSRAVAARNEEDSFSMVEDPAFDPARTVVIEGLVLEQGTDEVTANEPVEILARDSRSVRLRTTRARSGWLVTSQPWYPGWRATVNGVEKPIERANYAFGAVALDAGVSEIVLTCDPWSVRIGAWLSCAALVAIAAWFGASRGSGLSRGARAS